MPVEDSGVNTPDEHGYDTIDDNNSGINDYNNLKPPYSSVDEGGLAQIIFQEVDIDNGMPGKMLKCVETVDTGEYSEILNKVFDELKMYQYLEEIEHAENHYEVQVVWLNGKFDDSTPNNVTVGEDDINRDKLDDWNHKPGDLL
jgi:hypothetical protein